MSGSVLEVLMMENSLLKEAEEQAAKFVGDESLDLSAYLKEKALAFVPSVKHPTGGEMFIGDDAYSSLKLLFESLHQTPYFKLRIDFVDFRLIGMELFGDWLFERAENITDDNSFKVELEKRVRNTLKPYTVIVPCKITYPSRESVEIPFGDVRLVNSLRLKEIFESERESLQFGGNQPYWDDSEANYMEFFWFTIVTTTSVYKQDIAFKLAERASFHVLNLLHLFVSGSHSYDWDAGFQLDSSRRSFCIFKEANQNFEYSVNYKMVHGNVGIPNDFWSLLGSGRYAELVQIQGRCIDSFLAMSELSPAKSRLLDACYWIGDAMREKSLSVKVVKYVFGLERLVLFKSDWNGKRNMFANRVTLLLHQSGCVDKEELGATQDFFKKLYGLRSDIAHGSASPLISELPVSIVKVDRMARDATLSFMKLVEEFLDDAQCDIRLRKWFKTYVPKLDSNT